MIHFSYPTLDLSRICDILIVNETFFFKTFFFFLSTFWMLIYNNHYYIGTFLNHHIFLLLISKTKFLTFRELKVFPKYWHFVVENSCVLGDCLDLVRLSSVTIIFTPLVWNTGATSLPLVSSCYLPSNLAPPNIHISFILSNLKLLDIVNESGNWQKEKSR